MVKDTKIKGTIKYVLFFNCFTGTLCISLRSTHSPRHHKMILEGTQCLISSPGWSPVQPGLYSTLKGSLMVPLSSYLLEDMGLNPGNWSGVQGGYPVYHSILSHPRRPSLLDPLPLDLSASLLFSVSPAGRKILLTICLVPGPHYSAQINNHFSSLYMIHRERVRKVLSIALDRFKLIFKVV